MKARGRFALDSNVLVYAELEPKTDKGGRAQRVIGAGAPHDVIAVQALLEFIAVIKRRRPESLPSAMLKVSAFASVFEIAPTTLDVASTALALVRDHKFQVWDAVIWTAARNAGATIFLSEDLQDGFTLDGMRAVNPFALTEAELTTLLASTLA